MEDRLQDTSQNSRTRRLEKAAQRADVSNAWNFDFDDDESDGADVAAFENADSSVAGKDSPLGRDFEGPEEDFHRGSRLSKVHDVEYSDFERKESRVGFDDFDEDDDDVDSYELDSTRSNVPSRDFSEFEQELDSEDGGLDDDEVLNRSRAQAHFPLNKPSKPARRGVALSGSDEGDFDFRSDEELSAPSGWRSSHVADSGNRSGGRGLHLRRRLSYGSDEELGLDSDDDDLGERFRSTKSKMNNFSGKSRENSYLFSGSEESDDNDFSSRKGRKGKKGGGRDKRQGSNFKDSRSRNFDRDLRSRSNGGMVSRRRNNMEDDFETDYSQGFHGGSRGGFGDQRRGDRGGLRSFNGRRAEDEFGRRQHGRSRNYNEGRDGDDDFRNKRRVIER